MQRDTEYNKATSILLVIASDCHHSCQFYWCPALAFCAKSEDCLLLFILMSLPVDMVGPPSCLACHYVDVIYQFYTRWWLFWSLSWVSSLVSSAKFGDGSLSHRRPLFRKSPFISLSIWTINIFSSLLCWLINGLSIFFLQKLTSQGFMVANWFVSSKWDFQNRCSSASSVPHWHVNVVNSAFDYGLQ